MTRWRRVLWAVASLVGAAFAGLVAVVYWVGPCENCGGTGSDPDGPTLCPVCEGTGW